MDRKAQAETSLSKFLESWRVGDTETMLAHSQLTWRSTKKNPLSDLGALCQSLVITAFSILSTSQVSDFMMECLVEVNKTNRATVIVIKESGPYKPSEVGQWGVNPISALRLI